MSQNNKRYLMYIAQNYSYAILRPLQALIWSRGDEVSWFLDGDEVDSSFLRPEENRLFSVEEVKSWKPDAVFVPGNVVPSFIPGVKVEVFHGLNSGKVNHKGREIHFEIRSCFDLYCTQGPNTTERFEYLKGLFKTFAVRETGWPVLDPIFTPIADNNYLVKGDARPVVLFCSTFSHRLSAAPHLFDEVKRLAEKGNWRWLVQFHPKMPREIVERYKTLDSDNLTFVETDNVIPLLQAADVMLCDTSSILQMFILQRRPVVTFKSRKPGDYLLNVTEISDVEAALQKAISRPEPLMEAIDAYCEQLHPYRDGQSSARVLAATDKLIENGLDDLKPKPMNLLRHLKMRKKLGYWKL